MPGLGFACLWLPLFHQPLSFSCLLSSVKASWICVCPLWRCFTVIPSHFLVFSLLRWAVWVLKVSHCKAFPPPSKHASKPCLCPFGSELLLFPFLKDQQQNDLYYSSNGEPSAPFSGKILSPHKLADPTQCPPARQGAGSSCCVACFIGPSYLLARCYFLRCDSPFCRYDPYSFALDV